jgi:hypothetical protein
MPPSGDEPPISILDARLAEIDRRLHSIQSGLVSDQPPAEMPPPVAVPGEGAGAPPPLPPAEAHSAAELLIRLRELTAQQEGVLASMRQLLGTVQRVATTPPGGAPGAGGPVSVSAGPFTSTEALRAFRAALEALPGVQMVELRGFEGGDRAILEVHL